MAGSSPLMTETVGTGEIQCGAGQPVACCTQECVGIRWLTPRISTIAIPYRDGSTKARLAAGTAAYLRKPLGDRQFRAFSVRDEPGLDGRVRSSAPRVVLRSLGPIVRLRI